MGKLTHQNKSVIDYFGISGILLWILTYLVRKTGLIFQYRSLAIFWITPNLAFAWILTAMLKQLYRPSFSKTPFIKSSLTIKKYFLICVFVVLGALFNEIIFFLFLNINIDIYDVVATFVAQLIIFIFPIFLKEIS